MNYYQKAVKYMSEHEAFNGLTHALGGIGIGFLLAYPVAGAHPVRFGVFFLVLSAACHVWAMTHKP